MLGPENVIILPDIMPNGCISGHGCEIGKDLFGINENSDNGKNLTRNKPFYLDDDFIDKNYTADGNYDGESLFPRVSYPGRVDYRDHNMSDWVTIQENIGHLETLDGKRVLQLNT